MLNRASTNGTTYTRTSYKWFLWAKWDYDTCITHREIDRCLHCHQDYRERAAMEDLGGAQRELRRLDSQSNCEVQNYRNLDKSLEKDIRGEKVLTRLSERKLLPKLQGLPKQRLLN